MACWFYDGLLAFAVLMLAGWVFSIATQMKHAMEGRHLLMAVLFVVGGIYFAWFWSHGQTLAMRSWKIRVVDRHGRKLTQGRALLRYVFCWIWVLPPLAAFESRLVSGGAVTVLCAGWVAFWALLSRLHPERQFWHDAAAGTRLVNA